MANEWEVIGMPKSSIGAAFKLPITEPLISGPHNDFSLPDSFSAELAALKGQTLLEQLAAELKTKTNVSEKAKAASAVESLRDPFVDMMKSEALLTRTENGAATYAASGNPLVDFFFQVVEGSVKDDIDSLLDQAWEHAPLETLQLVAHLRDVREGKGEKERGWDAYIWLAQKHPRTLLVNLPEVVKVGFWKDLLQLLQRLCVGERSWTSAAKEEAARKLSSGNNRKQRRLAKQKRLHEWQASLRRAADPKTAAQQEAAGKAASRPAHRMGPHRRQREALAAEKRAAQAAEQEDDSDHSDTPSNNDSGLSGGKRKAPDAAVTADASQNGEDEAMSPTKAARTEKGTKAKVESKEVTRMRQERRDHFTAKLVADMERAAEARHQRALAAKRRVRAKLEADVGFRVLFAAVAHAFADQLRQDLADLQAGKQVSSLCAKWAPTPKQAHDNQTLIATAIAELLYPAEEFRQPGMSARDYTELARRSYAKEYLKPLREAACVPETKMAQEKWGEIDYERVASLCMKINKSHFSKHDKERLTEYLKQVKKGEKKIASGALKPHELVEEAMRRRYQPSYRASYLGYSSADTSDSEEDGAEDKLDAEKEVDAEEEVMEMQWKSYVDKLRQSGELSSCLAVADVSGSMTGEPMNVAIALSLLTAAVAKPPFNQLICTFASRPELHLVKGKTLVKQVQDVSAMDWGTSTNVDAVFDLILKKAVATSLKPEDMVSTIFIFSDMELDQAARNSYDTYVDPIMSDADLPSRLNSYGIQYPCDLRRQTNYQSVKARYEAAGYKLPQVVFWNLRASSLPGQKSTPVQFNEKGVALVSGFSGQLLKLFMEKPGDVDAWKDEMSPETVMMEAIKGKGQYDSWRVVD